MEIDTFLLDTRERALASPSSAHTGKSHSLLIKYIRSQWIEFVIHYICSKGLKVIRYSPELSNDRLYSSGKAN